MREANEASFQYLLFRSGAPLALPVGDVAEVLPYIPLIALPSASPFLAGIANVSGTALLVLRLASLLDLNEPPATIHSHLIRLAGDTPDVALLTERCEGVIDGANAEISALSDEATFNGCVTAELVTRGGATAYVLDVARLLTDEERRRVAAFAALGRDRLGQLEGPV